MAAPAPAAREPVPAPARAPAPPGPAPAAGPAAPGPGAAPGKLAGELARALVPADVPKEEVALQGGAALSAGPAVTEYLERKGPAGGPVRVRLGAVAAGTVHLRRTDKGLTTGPGGDYQAVPLLHPLLLPLRAEGIEPVLALRVHDGVLEGHASALVKGRLLGGGRALLDRIEECAKALGWAGLAGLRLPGVENELRGTTLVLNAGEMSFTLGGFLKASGSFRLTNEAVTFRALARGTVAGLGAVEVPVVRGPDGALSGSATADVVLRGFTGQVTAAFAAGAVDVRGTVRYANDRFDGQVTLVVTDAESARQLTDAKLPQLPKPAQAAPAAPAPAVPASESAGPRPGPRVVAGWGTLDVRLADWLRGEALVVVDHRGEVTLVGKITPRMDKPLFEQKDHLKQLARFEVRAAYGVPLVGNVFLFANIGLEAVAKIGPATLDRIELTGTWSTRPEVLKDFGLTATLNVPAFAGLRLKAEGGAGVQLLGHDIKAGIALSALAGIRGYVEATPRIGFREVADPKAGKRGEFFLAGHMEIAAQPLLGLAGELFVELDSPWWSPAPDRRWNWPLAQREYPLPGQFGIGADIEHVVGSGKVPEITFGEVDFSADKFLTDLVGDHVPAKTAKDAPQKGVWKEPGALAAAAPAARTPAALPSPTRAAPAPPAAPSRPGKDDGKVPSPAHQARWLAGMKAVGELREKSHSNPLDQKEMDAALADLRARFGFTVLTARQAGARWHLHAAMNPKVDDPEIWAELKEAWESGQDFDRAMARQYPVHQVELVEPGRKRGPILDAYVPGQWIISHKRAQIVDLDEAVYLKFLNQLEDHYAPGRIIADKPHAEQRFPQLRGQPLRGRWVLEVSEQRRLREGSREQELFFDRINLAMRRGVRVRDWTHHVYRDERDRAFPW